MEPVSEYRPRPPEHRRVARSAIRLGIDIGQRRDPSAVCVVELQERRVKEAGWDKLGNPLPPEFGQWHMVRHAQRFPIGTPYPEIAHRIALIVEKVAAKSKPTLLVDATGVGRPIIDLLKQVMLGLQYDMYAVTFTGGEKLRAGPGRWDLSLGKAYLVSRLQALLQVGKVKFPDTPEHRALADELANYEIRITGEANMQAGAFKSGTHDDLATALGLAVLLPLTRSQTWTMVEL